MANMSHTHKKKRRDLSKILFYGEDFLLSLSLRILFFLSLLSYFSVKKFSLVKCFTYLRKRRSVLYDILFSVLYQLTYIFFAWFLQPETISIHSSFFAYTSILASFSLFLYSGSGKCSMWTLLVMNKIEKWKYILYKRRLLQQYEYKYSKTWGYECLCSKRILYTSMCVFISIYNIW